MERAVDYCLGDIHETTRPIAALRILQEHLSVRRNVTNWLSCETLKQLPEWTIRYNVHALKCNIWIQRNGRGNGLTAKPAFMSQRRRREIGFDC